MSESCEVVKRQIILMYARYDRVIHFAWDIADTIDVFEYFFQQYEERFGCYHPRLTNESVLEAIQKLPSDPANNLEFMPEDYPQLIDAYFRTDFNRRTDHSLMHFLSGDIRMLRYYEALY